MTRFLVAHQYTDTVLFATRNEKIRGIGGGGDVSPVRDVIQSNPGNRDRSGHNYQSFPFNQVAIATYKNFCSLENCPSPLPPERARCSPVRSTCRRAPWAGSCPLPPALPPDVPHPALVHVVQSAHLFPPWAAAAPRRRGETSVNLCPNSLATSYPWEFHGET